MRLLNHLLSSSFLTLLGLIWAAHSANAVPITIFHTNDLHSHFRHEKTPLQLGGVARLKTAVTALRAQTPNSLLVDGGDWSEGSAYYSDGAGAAVLGMLDHLGYDVAIIGNHDWLNGPDTLLQSIEQAHPKVSLIETNFDYSKYANQSAFQKAVLPYVIKEVSGVKIAFIGLATYEFIYNQFISPIQINEPFEVARKMAATLRPLADAVVIISHNRISLNEKLLEFVPDVDLVIGAHDHVKLTEPRVVHRKGHSDGWVVEAGCWGKYLGRVDLDITPHAPLTVDPVKLIRSNLTQMDRNTAEDPGILQDVADVESHIESQLGPIFHEQVGVSQIELYRSGGESILGDFLTESYRQATGADIAVDIEAFVYGDIHAGVVDASDVFSADPAVFNPATGRSWNLRTLTMKGSTLSKLLGTYLSYAGAWDNALYTSGLTAILPAKDKSVTIENPINDQLEGLIASPIKANAPKPSTGVQLLFAGSPLDPNHEYKVVTGNGLIQTIDFINSKIDDKISTAGIIDSGLEGWRVLANSIQGKSPITLDKINIGSSTKSPFAELRTFYDDVNWIPISKSGNTIHALATIRITNYGEQASEPAGNQVSILKNLHANDWAQTPSFSVVQGPAAIPALSPGESTVITFPVDATEDRGAYSLVVQVETSSSGKIASDLVYRYFDGAALTANPSP